MYWILAGDPTSPALVKLAVAEGDEKSAKAVFKAIANGNAYEHLYLVKVLEVKG